MIASADGGNDLHQSSFTEEARGRGETDNDDDEAAGHDRPTR